MDLEDQFDWPYFYRISRSQNPILLVIPNNTGFPDNRYYYIEEKSQEKFQHYSRIFEELDPNILMPVFPRPFIRPNEDLYIHNLNRDVIETSIENYGDIPGQLKNMILHFQQNYLNKVPENLRTILFGFSASGCFSDRFSYFYPQLIYGVIAGGCDILIPATQYHQENLPYPLGMYDFLADQYREQKFQETKRFFFKGEEDNGGIVYDVDTHGNRIEYIAYEYEEMNIKNQKTNPSVPFHISGPLSDLDEKIIRARIFNNVFIPRQRFIKTKEIFEELKIANSEFRLYPETGHELSDKMLKDVKDIIKTWRTE